MKNFLKLALFLLVAVAAKAQGNPPYGAIQNFCTTGGQTVKTSGMSSSTTVLATYPKCLVSVYLTGTLTPAVIYKDQAGTILGNPFQANDDASWIFYVANTTGQAYDIVMSGGLPIGFPRPFTLSDVFPNNPGTGGGGGNIIPTPQYRGFIQPNTGTVAIAGGANWGTDATKNNIIANAGFVQSQNVPNPCVSVDSQGAVGDGLTEDGPAFRAAVALALENGTKAICLSSKTYKVSDVGGTIQLPGDSGACPSNAVGCTPLSPEPIHMQAYSVSFPSDFRVYGNNAIIEGPGPQASLTRPMTFVCSDDVTPGSIQPTRNGDPDYVLTYGSCINVQINNLKFNHVFVSFFGPGAVSKSLFEHLSFGSTGILMMLHISDRNVFRDFQDDNSFGGILVGGWWTTRCCYSGTAGYIIESGGYSDVTIINKYVHTQLGALNDSDAPALDNWVNDNFYKNENSTNGRALSTQPGHNFHGEWGMAYAAYARFQRPSNFGSITNMVLEGTGRQAIFEEGAHNQGYIGNFAFEVMGYCSFLSNVPAGSAGCPDPWGTGNGTIATGSVIYNGGGSMSMNSIAPNDGVSYQNTVWTPDQTGLISQQLNSGGSVGLQTYPGSRMACDSGNYTSISSGRVGCRFESYGGGIGLNGSTSRDGWVMQAFPATANTGVGPDSLVLYPAPIPQMAQHAYSVKISPAISLCRTIPTAFDTLPTNCTQNANNMTGIGTSLVTDVAPIIRTTGSAFFNIANNSNVTTFQVQDNGNVFTGASQAAEISTSGGSMLVRSRIGTLTLDTLNASNTNIKAQGVTGLVVFPSGGAGIGATGDPGASNFNVPGVYKVGGTGGFTGTKTGAGCVFTIQGGIITNVTGC